MTTIAQYRKRDGTRQSIAAVGLVDPLSRATARSHVPRMGRLFRPVMSAAFFLFPACSACDEDRFSLGGLGRFLLSLLGQPSRPRLFPRLTFRFASRGFGSLPGGQLGRLALFRCSSRRLALGNPTVTVRDCLLTNL